MKGNQRGEYISIHIGDAGVNMSNSVWELLCIEHGIKPNGLLVSDDKGFDNREGVFTNNFFLQTSVGKQVPRAVIVDLDNHATGELKRGIHRSLFDQDSIYSGKSSANIFPSAYYNPPKNSINSIMNKIRKQVNYCENLQGFLIFHSNSGGTGSGLTAKIVKELSISYAKNDIIAYSVFPSKTYSTNTVETYNSVLGLGPLLEDVDASIVFDNETLFNICSQNLEVESPTFTNINRLIAQLNSSITASSRFDNAIKVDVGEIRDHLLPYPELKLLVGSYSPICSVEKSFTKEFSVADITKANFDQENIMCSCEMLDGKYIACNLMYRGDTLPNDIVPAINNVKNQLSFVDWCSTGFKVGINYSQPFYVPGGDLSKTLRSSGMLCNTTAIHKVIERLQENFTKILKTKAYLHWYESEGMKETEFTEAAEKLQVLIDKYKEVESLMTQQDEGNSKPKN